MNICFNQLTSLLIQSGYKLEEYPAYLFNHQLNESNFTIGIEELVLQISQQTATCSMLILDHKKYKSLPH
jgi:hypothetical protein